MHPNALYLIIYSVSRQMILLVKARVLHTNGLNRDNMFYLFGVLISLQTGLTVDTTGCKLAAYLRQIVISL
jgi:ABC-type Mn2+/Zn2+ transport system permease subunit